jgi:nephrocystin-3
MQNTEFRVFISSTFLDLQEEREHLVKKIFPEVRARCRERGITFTEIDLRRGATEENVTSSRVIRTCLEEVDRSRPYFIGITGDRYGTVPKATEIASDSELIQKFPWVSDAIAEGASLIDLEFRHGALNHTIEDANTPRVFFYVRQRLWDRDSAAPDRMKLSALERRTKARGYKVSGYQSAEKLGEMIQMELLAILDRDFAKIVDEPVEKESIAS